MTSVSCVQSMMRAFVMPAAFACRRNACWSGVVAGSCGVIVLRGMVSRALPLWYQRKVRSSLMGGLAAWAETNS